MNIANNRRGEYFEDVEAGEVFEYNDVLYMRLSRGIGEKLQCIDGQTFPIGNCAAELETGGLVNFDGMDKAEVYIYRGAQLVK